MAIQITSFIFILVLFVSNNIFADKTASIPMDRLENDSDIVFFGYAKEQFLLQEKFVVINNDDGREELLDVQITKFDIEEVFKGTKTPTVSICSIIHPVKTMPIEKGKSYIIFAQKVDNFYQLTNGLNSMITVEQNKIVNDFFFGTAPQSEDLLLVKKYLRDFSKIRKKRIIKHPYNPYLNWDNYKIKNNPCD